ncbi:MAG: phenylalanine--tRNA ligase subunit beta, partial [Thermodesulfobacteriota bacterium]|nr:phenylalanine--tRNA ligase subunit beta [Thermodesulfobacteriota bacterium]
ALAFITCGWVNFIGITTFGSVSSAVSSVGDKLSEALGLQDVLFDISVTPNRGDCLSIIGIAREIAAHTGAVLHVPVINVIHTEEEISSILSVCIEDDDLCYRYSARAIVDVSIQPSPFWLRRRLESVGIRPINNVVDITNYVMMEYGQPLHAFDYNLLEGRRIIIKRAQPKERFKTLDGVERDLDENMLLICDGEKPIALAGVMGGENSEISDNTSTVILESAYFDPVSVRMTSRKLGLKTESSLRFERGIDIENVIHAANKAAQLIGDLASGKVAAGMIDQYPRPVRPDPIIFRISRCNSILGLHISKRAIKTYFTSLGLSIQNEEEDSMVVLPPTHRNDLTREIDLIEEVARLNKYEAVPIALPSVKMDCYKSKASTIVKEKVRNFLSDMGFCEVINYSFISREYCAYIGQDVHNVVEISNPLSEEQSLLRTSLLPGLLKNMEDNIHYSNRNLRLFEIGTVFFPQKKGLPAEVEHVMGIMTGARCGELWNQPKENVDFYDIKGIVEGVLDALLIHGCCFQNAENIKFLNPKAAARFIVNGEELGEVGEINPHIIKMLGINQTGYLFAINLSMLTGFAFSDTTIRTISRYPFIMRDFSIVVDELITHSTIVDIIEKMGIDIIESVSISDVYRGDQIPEGKKSMAYKVVYRHPYRTLVDEEVNEKHISMLSKVLEETGGFFR